MNFFIEIPGTPIAKARPNWPIPIEEGKILFNIEFLGDPVAHERPRKGRFGKFYTPSKTRNYKEALSWEIRLKIKHLDYKDKPESFYGLQAIFYRSTRQRIDVDNLLKTVLDSITQSGFWSDDTKVHEVAARVEKAQINPHTNFIVYLYNSTNFTKTSPEMQS